MRKIARGRTERQAAVIVIGLLMLLLFSIIMFKSNTPPAAAVLLDDVLGKLEKTEGYSLTIVEKGPGFNLYFEGQVEKGNTLSGFIHDFNLDVLYAEGILFVKTAGTENWEEADQLESLKSFLISPVELLHSLKKRFSAAVPGQEIILAGLPCRTVYLDISNEEALIGQLFPEINYDTVSNVNLGAAFAEPGLTLIQLRIVVAFNSGERQLERAYFLDY